MENKVIETIEKYNLISHDERILVALSGGADSVALLHVLKVLGYKIHAAHINHMIRGEEAVRDERFVVNLCATLGIPLSVYQRNCPEHAKINKLTLEEAARILRYEALGNACTEFDCQKIATAHTENDNLETMLMRLIRGTYSYGLRGIDIKRDHIIRPLLHLKREDIESYTQKHSLPYMNDSTNKDLTYFRNRVRHTLLPELESTYNSNIRAALSRLSESLKTDADYFAHVVKLSYEKFVTVMDDCIVISSEAALELHPAILERLIRLCVATLAGDDKDFDHVHTMITKTLFEKKSGKKVNLAKGIAATNSFGDVAIYKERPAISEEIPLLPGDFIRIGESNDFISLFLKPISKENFINTCTDVFICDKMVDSIVVRGRRDGDMINKPCGKRVKLKDFFIERRIPAFMRDNIFVVAQGKTVIMVLSPVNYAAPPHNTAGGAKKCIALWRKV